MSSLPDNDRFDQSLDKIARTATASGAAADTGREFFVREAIIDVGTWTDGDHTFTFEERPTTAAAWVALTADQLDDPAGALTAAALVIDDGTEDDTIIQIGLLATERFTRVVQTVAGGPATGLVSGANIHSSDARHAGGLGDPMSAAGASRTQPVI